MSRPLNKAQLLASIQKEYINLEKFLTPLTADQLAYAPTPGAWAIKDILTHLYEWQQMFFTWYDTGLRGETPVLPAPGYKWSQLPALNQAIYDKHHGLTSEQTLALFRQSHQKTVQFIDNLTESDLTQPGLYRWMNQNSLIAYLNSITAAHYLWAIKDARKALKS